MASLWNKEMKTGTVINIHFVPWWKNFPDSPFSSRCVRVGNPCGEHGVETKRESRRKKREQLWSRSPPGTPHLRSCIEGARRPSVPLTWLRARSLRPTLASACKHPSEWLSLSFIISERCILRCVYAHLECWPLDLTVIIRNCDSEAHKCSTARIHLLKLCCRNMDFNK